MKLSDMFGGNNRILHKRARLKVDIKLDNDREMKAGEEGSVLIDYGNGEYHFEHNDFACRVKRDEIEFI